MASDTVTTIFGGDDSGFQAAAKRVLSAIQGIASFKAPADSFRGVHDGLKGVHAGAGQAVVAVEALKGSITGMLGVVGAIAGATTIVAAFGKAIHEATERETAAQQLGAVADAGENLAGVMEKLEEASSKTARDFPELAKGVQAFKEAGVPLEQAADNLIKLNEISLVTGKPLEDLTQVFTRMSVKGEATFKDLAKFIAVPGVSQLAREFKGLQVDTENLARSTEKQIELWKREDEVANKTAAAINSFAQETGIAAETFKAFKESGETSGKILNLGDISGLGAISGKVLTQFQEGMAQIGKETGLSQRQIKDFIDAGKIGFQSLLSASQRYHEEQQKARDQTAQDKLRGQQEAVVTKQQGLVSQVQQLIEKGIDPAKLDKWFETFAGKWYKFAHQISETFEAFGTPLLEALKPLMDHLNSDLMPKMQEIAGKFGGWLSDEAQIVIQAFETGDWSKVQKQLADAFGGAVEMLVKGMQLAWEVFAEASQSSGVVKAFQALGELAAEAVQIAMGSVGATLEKQIKEAERHLPGIPQVQERETKAFVAERFSPAQKAELEKSLQAETTEGVPGAGTIGNYVNKVLDIWYRDESIRGAANIKPSMKKFGDGIAQDFEESRKILQDKLNKIFGSFNVTTPGAGGGAGGAAPAETAAPAGGPAGTAAPSAPSTGGGNTWSKWNPRTNKWESRPLKPSGEAWTRRITQGFEDIYGPGGAGTLGTIGGQEMGPVKSLLNQVQFQSGGPQQGGGQSSTDKLLEQGNKLTAAQNVLLAAVFQAA